MPQEKEPQTLPTLPLPPELSKPFIYCLSPVLWLSYVSSGCAMSHPTQRKLSFTECPGMLLAAPTPQPFLFKPQTTQASSSKYSSWLAPRLYTALCSNPAQGREVWGRGFGGQIKVRKPEGQERTSRQTGLKTTMVGFGRGSLRKTRGWEQAA